MTLIVGVISNIETCIALCCF